MKSWFPRQQAPAGPLMALQLLGLLLVPWTLRLAGGQSVSHTGPAILVSLANMTVPFSCRITYPYTPEFKDFTVSYFHVDLQGQKSPEKQKACHPGQGTENKTYTLKCLINPRLPDASATGTYYCCVHWQSIIVKDGGTFILVRETKASSKEASHPVVPRPKMCQPTLAAHCRICLHGPAAPGDRSLRLHRERGRQPAPRPESSLPGEKAAV
ncbi:NFAT activation molecule 1 isoform X3 [Heterocephalus glaber]|uniref:NFAT activation molecule 1 isoform X3 n=1 Tax=Heterocephalus glaber TaxID=10181 RepID=A0AAX6P7V5_HETGA|nr:NFAT activation molecule 1 isoform X3 [Heterocephalus glaber]